MAPSVLAPSMAARKKTAPPVLPPNEVLAPTNEMVSAPDQVIQILNFLLNKYLWYLLIFSLQLLLILLIVSSNPVALGFS